MKRSRTASMVLVAAVLVCASCRTGLDQGGAPAPESTPTTGRTHLGEQQSLDPVLHGADAALREFDEARGGGIYKGLERQGPAVYVRTTLPPKPANINRAVAMCETFAAEVGDDYRVSVNASTGRALAFRIAGECRRMHLKAQTTLWGVAPGRSGVPRGG